MFANVVESDVVVVDRDEGVVDVLLVVGAVVEVVPAPPAPAIEPVVVT